MSHNIVLRTRYGACNIHFYHTTQGILRAATHLPALFHIVDADLARSYIHICIYIYTHIYVYIYIYTHTHMYVLIILYYIAF